MLHRAAVSLRALPEVRWRFASAPARAAAGAEDGSDWPGTLKGQHRQVVDAYAPNDGFPLAFAFYVPGDKRTSKRGRRPGDRGVVLRHTAFPLALDHTMWQKLANGTSEPWAPSSYRRCNLA